MIAYLVCEDGGQHGVVGRRNDEVVVEVVVTVRLVHLTQVRLDLEVTPKAFLVFRNAVALRSYAIWCRSLEIETTDDCTYLCYCSVLNVLPLCVETALDACPQCTRFVGLSFRLHMFVIDDTK